MKSIILGFAALALTMALGYRLAEASEATAPASDNSTVNTDAAKPGKYWGTDTDGKRVAVQAPAGGNSRAQADAAEAPITQNLNEQALTAASKQTPATGTPVPGPQEASPQ